VAYANGILAPGSRSFAAVDDVLIQVFPPIPIQLPAAGPMGLGMLAGLLALLGRRHSRAYS
jgi:hypothetical protein